MTSPTSYGAKKLMESSNEVVIMKINKAEIRSNIIILNTEDKEKIMLKCGQKMLLKSTRLALLNQETKLKLLNGNILKNTQL